MDRTCPPARHKRLTCPQLGSVTFQILSPGAPNSPLISGCGARPPAPEPISALEPGVLRGQARGFILGAARLAPLL